MSINLDQARAIIAGGFAHAASAGMKPLAIVVLDAGGHVVAAERQDGSPNKRFEIAHGKAHGAISLGVSSRQLGEFAIERPHFIVGAAASINGAIVPVAGAVLVTDGSRNIGSVGVSGDTSDNDEAVAIAGIEAAGLQVTPG
jgi:uncharacterized protein GlcG (DUF336 family)